MLKLQQPDQKISLNYTNVIYFKQVIPTHADGQLSKTDRRSQIGAQNCWCACERLICVDYNLIRVNKIWGNRALVAACL